MAETNRTPTPLTKKKKRKPVVHEYPDDIFADTRMSFGDHIEELRVRMLWALKWLILFMVLGFILDAIGKSVGNPSIGIAFPMMEVITEPIKQQVGDFYNRRIERVAAERLAGLTQSPPDEARRVQEKLRENNFNLSALSAAERRVLLGAPVDMDVEMDAGSLEPVFGPPRPDAPPTVAFKLRVFPAQLNYLNVKGEGLLEARNHLTTLSAQEGFVVYFKVQILCGIVLASPFILYQFWAFVGAGLYPHERRYVYLMFGPSLFLFLAGVLLCQFVVLPGAVKALLAFNEWLGFDPDIRLSEWLGLAIILPLVFGVSFQTPLVMVFLNRIGMFTAADYVSKWRYACIIMAFLAALLTPTPDAVTMLYLFVPMFGLYLGGIAICHYFPAPIFEEEGEEAEEEVAV
jgi:sec-independent protein translocase protein TatC